MDFFEVMHLYTYALFMELQIDVIYLTGPLVKFYSSLSFEYLLDDKWYL